MQKFVLLKETFKHDKNLCFAHSVHLAMAFLKVKLLELSALMVVEKNLVFYQFTSIQQVI